MADLVLNAGTNNFILDASLSTATIKAGSQFTVIGVSKFTAYANGYARFDGSGNLSSIPIIPPVWVNATNASYTMDANTGYICANVSPIAFQLPILADIGDEFEIRGFSAGGWTLQANASQTIIVGKTVSSVAGSVASTDATDGLKLVCTAANVTFSSCYYQGNLDVL